MLGSSQWVNSEVASIFARDITVTITINVNVDAEWREKSNDEVGGALLVEAGGVMME